MGRRLIFYKPVADILIDPHKGKEDKGAGQVKNGVGIGNASGIDGLIPDAVQKPRLVDQGDRNHNENGFAQVKQDIDKAHPSGIGFCAYAADNGRGQAVAQINAHQHGVDLPKGHLAGRGKRLQDTYGGGGALEHKGHTGPSEAGQKGVLSQAGEKLFHDAAVRKDADRVGHGQKPGKEDPEPYDDMSDLAGIPGFHPRDHQTADDDGQRRQGGGLQKLQKPGSRGADIQKPDDLPGDRGAYVGADDDAQGLVEGDDACPHESGGENNGGL